MDVSSSNEFLDHSQKVETKQTLQTRAEQTQKIPTACNIIEIGYL